MFQSGPTQSLERHRTGTRGGAPSNPSVAIPARTNTLPFAGISFVQDVPVPGRTRRRERRWWMIGNAAGLDHEYVEGIVAGENFALELIAKLNSDTCTAGDARLLGSALVDIAAHPRDDAFASGVAVGFGKVLSCALGIITRPAVSVENFRAAMLQQRESGERRISEALERERAAQ